MSAHTTPDRYGTPASVEVGPDALPGESRARRLRFTADRLLYRPADGINTTWDIIQNSAAKFGDKQAMGWRDVVDIVTEEKEVTKTVDGEQVTEKKQWQFFQMSEYKYMSYKEVRDAVSEIGRGLLELGIERDEIFNIYSRTSIEWQLVANGCAAISTPVATAYDSLGIEGLTHSLNEPGCVGMFTNAELLPTVLKVLPDVASVRIVVYEGKADPSVLAQLTAVRGGIKVLTVDELRSTGRSRSESTMTERAPSPDSAALLMYTSGSTGAPKGVVIKHSNLTAAVASLDLVMGPHTYPDERYLAYLPLAHILEFVTELNLIYQGALIGYGRVKTLTDASVRNCKGDMVAFEPTALIGVPAVWEMIKKGIVAKIDSGPPSKKRIVNLALAVKKAGVPVLANFFDKAILSKLRAATGGRVRVALSGGAPLSPDTQAYLSNALLPILQGYGLTETCGMCSIQPPTRAGLNSVGIPMPSTEIKLLDVPEVGYKAQGNPPQGEICIRGPSVVSGYYKRPDLNNDTSIFTEDGWFRTGDVGQWNADGTLSIIDRVKNLVKLENGEYIALERLEATYKSCNLVGNICVHAEPNAKSPVAVIFPHEMNLRIALGMDKSSLADLCQRKNVKDMILKACNAAGKARGFKPMEFLAGVVLTPDEWTPETGLVTAAQKVQRKKIAERFGPEIKAISV